MNLDVKYFVSIIIVLTIYYLLLIYIYLDSYFFFFFRELLERDIYVYISIKLFFHSEKDSKVFTIFRDIKLFEVGLTRDGIRVNTTLTEGNQEETIESPISSP